LSTHHAASSSFLRRSEARDRFAFLAA
jgi:hypothetical protein